MTMMAAKPIQAPRTCDHIPCCPAASAPDRDAALIYVSHPEQGWSLLCNGIVLFEDTGELLPDGRAVDPHRPTDHWSQDTRRGKSGALSGAYDSMASELSSPSQSAA